jgi:hypothetical protein
MKDMYSIPKTYDKPHKFFETFLDNDLNKLEAFLKSKYTEIEQATLKGVKPLHSEGQEYWLESGSLSTIKWKEYNVFQFYSPEIYKVFVALRDTVKEACEYYGINFEEQQYMVQGWFNINDRKVGKLDWHDHGGPWAPYFHGYYCIKAEPSSTWYKIDNKEEKIFENKNLDNRLIVSEMGHPHAMGNWDWDGARVTLAYDIIPLKMLGRFTPEQHYIPLI